MKCERVRELVSDALDGVLPRHVVDRFHTHLDTCPPCRTYHSELKESLLLLEELPAVEVDDSFDRAVWARIRAEEEPRSLWDFVTERLQMLRVRFSFGTGLWRWSPAMAGAIVLFGVVVANPPASIMDPTVDPPTPASIGPISSLREDVPELRTDQVSSEEVTGPLPAAVEAFLQNSAELRLGRDNYRNAVYSYPMRRIPDQVFVSDRQVYGTAGFRGAPRTLGQPVGVTVPLQGPPQGQNGVAVLTF